MIISVLPLATMLHSRLAPTSLAEQRVQPATFNSPGELSLRGCVVELGGSLLTVAALHGAEPGNTEDTRQAAENFENIVGWAHNLPMFSGTEA